MEHISVLLEESIKGLNVKSGGIYVDATLGRAGHSSVILEKLVKGHLYAFDKDNTAISKGKEKLSKINNNFTIIKDDFKNINQHIDKADGILFDLGVSSPQLDDASRGFSYRFDAKLDMRMNQDQDLSAFNVVNEYEESKLEKLIKEYGDEKFAWKIAKAICQKRIEKPIETTFELVDIIKDVIPAKFKRHKHPAKKTFQAIRIEVNGEIASLRDAILNAANLLNSKGRLSVITFHSGEDRIVKNVFNELSEVIVDFNNPLPDTAEANYIKITKKPITATPKELEMNKRSTSAKLRILERR